MDANDIDFQSSSTTSTSSLSTKSFYYKDLNELKKRVGTLKTLKSWVTQISENNVVISKPSKYRTTVSEFEIEIDSGLGFTIKVYDCFLPEDHVIYKNYRRSMTNITISNLVLVIEKSVMCNGIVFVENTSSVFFHVIPLMINDDDDEEVPLTPFPSMKFVRAQNCFVLADISKCESCQKQEKVFDYGQKKKQKKLITPAKLKAPLAATDKSRIGAALKAERLKCQQTTAELNKMKLELQRNSVQIDEQLSNDFTKILSDAKEVTPFMNLFWQQQKEMFKVGNRKNVRFHPMIIRYCLSLYLKSKAAYEELRNSGVLVLPSSRTLIDYKNHITPKVGFSNDIIEDLKIRTNEYIETERYIVICFDEMKIKGNLVFDKFTGEMKGFLDLGSDFTELSTIGREVDDLASHALVFYLRGIVTDLKYSFAYFATDGVISIQLMALFWEAVTILEFICNLWVVAATSDGASPNRKFFQMHREGSEICYKTVNICEPSRYIYWFSDAPHIMKTTRNCWASSGAGKCTRYMWNNDKNILWTHLTKIFYDELSVGGLKCLPRLTSQHIHLTPFSVMTVKYATQVLSESVSKALKRFGGEEAQETAHLCDLMDSWFDCMNTRYTVENKNKEKKEILSNKPFIAEYRHQDDERFGWLLNTFLPYFQKWEENTQKRVGNYTKTDREKMFISRPTYVGLIISTHSLVECTQFLLSKGIKYILSERFCQDVVEEYFGHQRKLGRRSDNPDIVQFGYNDNALRIQRYTSRITGNTRGRYCNKKTWEEVSNDPVPKRKQKRAKKES